MLRSDAAYSDNFSTIFRAARGSKISEEVLDEDLNGKDPLPKYLQKAKVWLPGFKDPAQPVAAYKRAAALDAPLDVALPNNQALPGPNLRASHNVNHQHNVSRSNSYVQAQSGRILHQPIANASVLPRRAISV